MRRIAALEYTVAILAERAGISMVPPPAEDPDGFERLWEAYPRRMGGNPKPLARKAYLARLRDGVDPNALYDAVMHYATFCREQAREGTEYVMQAATFLGPNGRWEEYMQAPAAKPDADLDDLMATIAERET